MDIAKQLTISICSAMRSADTSVEVLRPDVEKLMKSEPNADLLQSLEMILLSALRGRKQDVFLLILNMAGEKLTMMAHNTFLAQPMQQWISNVTFAVCDRHMIAVYPFLQMLVNRWWKANVLDVLHQQNVDAVVRLQALTLAQAYTRETLSLAARMARREWRDTSEWLWNMLASVLYRTQDLRLWQDACGQMSLHFIAYAKWDGFHKACTAYRELHVFYLLLLRKACKEQDGKLLEMTLRSMREVVTNSARSTMQDEMDIWRAWYEYLWPAFTDEDEGVHSKRKQELRRLLQLGIAYWNGTMPKSSRKQVRFLRDLLEPDVLTAEERKLLGSII